MYNLKVISYFAQADTCEKHQNTAEVLVTELLSCDKVKF